MIGKVVSHYKILEHLGSGGMGAVYKARDLKLDRTVALKFLHPDLTRDVDLKGRFVLEAKTASSLRHANICVIHDIDEMDDGQMFIVMEYYEGETLKSKIEKGSLTITETIDTGIHVASGLTRAHEEHLVHRDIKPANIMISPRGEVSILDFGLAKLTGGDRHTRAGSLLGTLAYMSPEQVRGEDVDHRTDIWSLGIVLYEMLTGGTPFGNYEPVLVYFILNQPPPPMDSKGGTIPEELQRIVSKCLEKHPADRYQSLADLIVDLRRFKRASDGSERLPTPQILTGRAQFIHISKRTRKALVIAGGCVAAVLAIVLLWRPAAVQFFSSILMKSPKKEVYWFTRGTGMSDFPDWSPNGDGIVFASEEGGNMDLWKQRTPTSNPDRMTFSTANETFPTWSPDGRNIAFCSDSVGGMVMVVSSEGGTPTVIAPVKARPRWSPDGKRLSLDWKYAIYVLDFPPEGEPRQIVPPTTAEPSTIWSSDGHHLMFWDRRQGDICVVPSSGGAVTPLNVVPNGEEITGMSCSRDGSTLILCRGQFGGPKELWRLKIDPETCKPMAEPVQLHLSTDDIVRCSLSPDGKQLAFTARSVERYLYEISLDPRTGLDRGTPALLTTDRGLNYYPGLSKDGRRLVWTHQEANRAFLFVKDLPEGKPKKVTPDRGPETGDLQFRELGGAFSPADGKILFSQTPEGGFGLWYIHAAGASFSVKLTNTNERKRDVHPSISPDGSKVLFYSNRSDSWDIYMVGSANVSEPRQMTKDSTNEMYPAWSNNGRLIAFCTDRNSSPDIWIMDSSASDLRPLVQWPSEECWPVWSNDDQRLYFVSKRSAFFNIWMIDISTGRFEQITRFRSLLSGLPETGTYTKLAVAANRLVFPIESRTANIHILSNPF